jgi:hypothetical protein
MASVEARLQVALDELRRVNGTVAVLLKERDREENIVSDVQDVLNYLLDHLHGDAKKEALRMEKRCQEWRTRQDRINL